MESNANIAAGLKKVFTLIGIKQGNLPTNIDELIAEIRKDLGRFSVNDMILAFKFFARGVMDYSLKEQTSVQSFSWIFLENVMQSYHRFRIKYFHKSKTETPPPPPGEVERIHQEATADKFRRYISDGVLMDWGNASYDYLESKGLLNFTDAQKIAFEDRAAGMIKGEAHQKQFKGTLQENFGNYIESIEKRQNPSITIKAKKLALAAYFDELIDQSLDIRDVLNIKKESA